MGGGLILAVVVILGWKTIARAGGLVLGTFNHLFDKWENKIR